MHYMAAASSFLISIDSNDDCPSSFFKNHQTNLFLLEKKFDFLTINYYKQGLPKDKPTIYVGNNIG
jgi:hypothetical protein